MRALLLCSLGAVLMWFVWHALASAPANAAYEPASPGAMLPPEPPAATARGESAPSASPPVSVLAAASVAPASGEEAVAAQTIPPVAHTEDAHTITTVPVTGLGAGDKVEIDLARVLISSPETFAAAVSGQREIPTARRNLALALDKALSGKRDEARVLADLLDKDPLVTSAEVDFLTRLIGGKVTASQASSVTSQSPLTWAALLVSESRTAESLTQEGKAREASQVWSEVLLDYVRGPWAPDADVLRRWTASLTKNQQKHRWNRLGEWPSLAVKVEPGDSLIALRKRVLKDHPEMLLCTGQIERANGIRGTAIQPGQTLKVPTDRARMLVDLDARWAFYIVGGEVAGAWEVGVGKDGGTQTGEFTAGEKKEQPMWFRQGHAPVPYGAPENPLGTRWIAWLAADGTSTGLGFHGTNQPESIGKSESQGCIRMRNTDVEELFEILPKGATITVQP